MAFMVEAGVEYTKLSRRSATERNKMGVAGQYMGGGGVVCATVCKVKRRDGRNLEDQDMAITYSRIERTDIGEYHELCKGKVVWNWQSVSVSRPAVQKGRMLYAPGVIDSEYKE